MSVNSYKSRPTAAPVTFVYLKTQFAGIAGELQHFQLFKTNKRLKNAAQSRVALSFSSMTGAVGFLGSARLEFCLSALPMERMRFYLAITGDDLKDVLLFLTSRI